MGVQLQINGRYVPESLACLSFFWSTWNTTTTTTTTTTITATTAIKKIKNKNNKNKPLIIKQIKRKTTKTKTNDKVSCRFMEGGSYQPSSHVLKTLCCGGDHDNNNNHNTNNTINGKTTHDTTINDNGDNSNSGYIVPGKNLLRYIVVYHYFPKRGKSGMSRGTNKTPSSPQSPPSPPSPPSEATTTKTATTNENKHEHHEHHHRKTIIIGHTECNIYSWESNDAIIVIDIDGTITTSDLGGAFDTLILKRYDRRIQDGVCNFFNCLNNDSGTSTNIITIEPDTDTKTQTDDVEDEVPIYTQE